MIKFRYKRKPAVDGGAHNKDTTNVQTSSAKKESPSTVIKAKVISTKSATNKIQESVQPTATNEYYINLARPLSPCQLIIPDEHIETSNSCIRAVVVSEKIISEILV